MSKSTAQIEREVEQQRYEVEETIDALREKMSVGGIIDQAMQMFSGTGSPGRDMVQSIGQQVKSNPLPLMLTGIGLAWLMMGDTRGQPGAAASGGYTGPYPARPPVPRPAAGSGAYPATAAMAAGADAGSSGPGLGERMSGAAGQAAAGARSAADSVRHGAGSATSGVKQGAESFAAGISDAAGTAYERAAHGANHAADSLAEGYYQARDAADLYGRRARRSIADFIHEEPLIVGALGLAVGAAVGAALPATRTEDEYVGPYRDDLRDSALGYTAEQADKAERVAEKTYEAARQSADREGLIPESGGPTLAERAEHVVRAAKDTAKAEAKKEHLGS